MGKRVLRIAVGAAALLVSSVWAQQNVGIGTNTPHPTALLELYSTSKGLLIPRMTQAERDAISSPATGLLIYQTDNTPGFYYWNGTAWIPLLSSSSGSGLFWSLTGNSITGTEFLGTTNAQPLVIRTNNTERVRVTATGNVGIGTAAPTERLQVSDGNVAITNTDNTARQLRLYEPSGAGTNFTAFRAQAQASDIIYTLPASLTPTSTVGAGILQTDASGNLSWLNPTALAAATAWALTGNSIASAWNGTTGSFLGTTNAQPLVIATTNTTSPQPIQVWVGNQETFRFNPPGSSAPAWSIQRGGGNQRGLHAVDLQSARSAPTQVASGNYSVIGGGEGNTASDNYATVGGGQENTASGAAATVGGGSSNAASGNSATVCGGESNIASGQHATVGGGSGNAASGNSATVCGGESNIASGAVATVGGGTYNIASGDYSAIPGGFYLRVGERSFGFSGQTSNIHTDLSANSNIAAFVDVDLWLYSRDRTQASQLRFYEAQAHGSGANYVALRAPNTLSANTTYTLPASLTPTSAVGAGILQTDASGNLSWLNPTALAAATAWALTGNSIASAWNGTTGSFLGTTNAQPLVIATTNTTTPQPIQVWVGNQETFRFNPPGSSAPAWSIQRGGGNQRGLHAVDLQSARSAATQVASGDYSVIGGGTDNTASGGYATVGGGRSNTANNAYATVGGGYINAANSPFATVGGGQGNTASGNFATVGGGIANTASGNFATVGGGYSNTASGDYSAIPGGAFLQVGTRSFGFSGQTTETPTDLSANSNIAAFVDVDLWLYSRDFTSASQLRLYEAQAHSNGAEYVAFQAPNTLTTSTTYTLPADLTTTNTVAIGILQTDASGNLSWLNPAALVTGSAWALTGNSGTNPAVNFLGTTDAQPLVIRTNNTERVRVTATGNVGIGTSSPTERLQVSDGNIAITNTDNTARQLRLYEPSGAGTNFTAFRAQAQASDIIYTLPASLTPTSAVGAGILQTDASGNLSWLNPTALVTGSAWALTGNSGTNPAVNFLGTTDAQPLVIRTNNTERVRVTASGDVGIGTTTPLEAVEVVREGVSPAYVSTSYANANFAGAFVGRRARGTMSAPAAVQSGDALVFVGARGYDGTAFTSASRAFILMEASENWTATAQGTRIRFATTANGTTSTAERVVIQSSGDVEVKGGNVLLQNSDNTARELRLYEPSGAGANFTAFRAQAQASDIIYTLPASLTPTSTVAAGILQTDASGNLSWLSPAALVTGSAWALTGNSGTNPAVNFLGTTDAQPLVIRVNNTQTFQFNTNLSLQRDAGGNARGQGAVDLQSARSVATQVASGNYSVIGGGAINTASGDAATVGGGASNTASGVNATVGGGSQNIASGNYATVGGGGPGNTASGVAATVGGGSNNTASGQYATVGGGRFNTASGDYSAIPGGNYLRVGNRSFGFSGQTSATQTDLSANSNIAAFVDVDLWLYSRDFTNASQLRFYEAQAHGSGANYVALRAPTSLSANTTYTLPASAPATAAWLQSDNTGAMSWRPVLYGTVTVDPPNIGANTSTTFTVTITGVQSGDLVFLTPPSTLEGALIFQGANVTAANTVTIRMRNVTTAAVNGAALQWSYMVIRP
jgi:hypothetical protein